ncbi:MAG: hypothetical protein HF981_24625 [Desulfobacteraceae bacterium]|nr:hypothetical protein [Desulfobacteraceae bacterium]MBC2753603.1 hypothetical protein [Desulfobacteraceae bacterium]
MKRLAALGIMCSFLVFLVEIPMTVAGGGFMGGRGAIVVEDPPAADEGDSTTDEGGLPDTVDGPLNDKMADAGKLFGDLYKILRYEGGEDSKHYDIVDSDDDGVPEAVESPRTAIGGEPELSEAYGWYAAEVVDPDETITYVLAEAPIPSLCVQPVADYARWGDISSQTDLDHNRLPLIMSYDATWFRTECEVGQLIGYPRIDEATGAFITPLCSADVTDDCINPYFIEPGGTWQDVEYCDGVLYADLVDEVHFGRMNLSRSPEAVLQAAFDEAVTAINNAARIERDAAGRLLLTTEIYEEFPTEYYDDETDTWVCEEVLVETRTKAIDSPLENLALYVKLLKDGHLVTPGDERAPIDRSEKGGMPLWKMLELSDGPSSALRPTIDIEKLEAWGLDSLVDVAPQEYYTYYECYTENGTPTPCLCEGENHDGTPKVVACEDVVSRELRAVDICPDPTNIPGTIPNSDSCDEEPWYGIKTDDSVDHGDKTTGDDFDFAAAFLAAAGDKTGDIGVDMVVYLNSILGINKVVGYSEYDEEGNPDEDADSYETDPVYFDFAGLPGYGRETAFNGRGQVSEVGGAGDASTYDGTVKVLIEDEGSAGTWYETPVFIMGDVNGETAVERNGILFDQIGLNPDNTHPDGTEIATDDIRGFAQMADDDLSVIKFVHTNQIPGLR